MALLNPGHFQSTHFPSAHWQTSPQHWPEYGAALPPAPTPSGGWRGFYRPPQPKLNVELLRLLKEWLELKIAESN